MEICEQKDDVVVITPAMIGGRGLTAFSRKYPEKLYFFQNFDSLVIKL